MNHRHRYNDEYRYHASVETFSSRSACTKSCPMCPKSRLTLCDPMDLPGSSVLRISQARLLERVAIFFSRGPSWPRDWTHISCLAGESFYHWATGEVLWRLLEWDNKIIMYLRASFTMAYGLGRRPSFWLLLFQAVLSVHPFLLSGCICVLPPPTLVMCTNNSLNISLPLTHP